MRGAKRDPEVDKLLRKPIANKVDSKSHRANAKHVRGWSIGDRSNFTDSQIELMEEKNRTFGDTDNKKTQIKVQQPRRKFKSTERGGGR